MVNKETKRKLKRIWCERLVIGLCVPVALGFSIVKVQSVSCEAKLTWKAQQAQQQMDLEVQQQAQLRKDLLVQMREDLRQQRQALQQAQMPENLRENLEAQLRKDLRKEIFQG